eukprot:COSAG06_NODE_1367_length_9687_cov_6.213496_10_plen_40_part_00
MQQGDVIMIVLPSSTHLWASWTRAPLKVSQFFSAWRSFR